MPFTETQSSWASHGPQRQSILCNAPPVSPTLFPGSNRLGALRATAFSCTPQKYNFRRYSAQWPASLCRMYHACTSSPHRHDVGTFSPAKVLVNKTKWLAEPKAKAVSKLQRGRQLSFSGKACRTRLGIPEEFFSSDILGFQAWVPKEDCRVVVCVVAVPHLRDHQIPRDSANDNRCRQLPPRS